MRRVLSANKGEVLFKMISVTFVTLSAASLPKELINDDKCSN